MSHQRPLIRRQPRLQAIGRSEVVDLEEPPEIAVEDEDVTTPYYFYVEDAELTCNSAEQLFTTLNPGAHPCYTFIAECSYNFVHCQPAVEFAAQYGRLRRLLETRARLQLTQDCASRIAAASKFIAELKKITKREYGTWHRVCQGNNSAVSATNLESLCSICDELRIHMGHWNSIRQRADNRCRLESRNSSLTDELEKIHVQLTHLRDTAIWWIDRLINIGLRVLAHCDVENFRENTLWEILRGLEDFNLAISTIGGENNHAAIDGSAAHDSMIPHTNRRQKNGLTTQLDKISQANSYHNLSVGIKPIPFARVLSVLANERSKCIASIVHKFFTTHEQFLDISQCQNVADYSWTEKAMKEGDKHTAPSCGETSDYYTASESSAMLQTGSLVAPDLSKDKSPVIAFSQMEYDFAVGFLQIVCHSTNLLRRPVARQPSQLSDAEPDRTSLTKRKGSTTRDGDDTGARGVSDAERKSVSWSDAKEVTIIQQLVQRYMQLLWQHFGRQVLELFQRPAFEGTTDTSGGQLGSIVLCPDAVVMMIVHMVQQTCVKDIFPSLALSPLCFLAKQLLVFKACAAWDRAFCKAIGHQVTDKCHPTPLVDGAFSTQTAKLLRDSFRPLQTILTALEETKVDRTGHGHNDMCRDSNRDANWTLLMPSIDRLVATCDASTTWCENKASQLLSAGALPGFLLVTHSDLQLLGDEMQKSLVACQLVCAPVFKGEQQQLQQQQHQQKQQQQLDRLRRLWQQLQDFNAKNQTLSGTLMRQFLDDFSEQAGEFFEEVMPQGALWKKKCNHTTVVHSEYIEMAMDTLIDPVVSATERLRGGAQVGVISRAVTALCKAWMNCILKHKIRFSYHGAVQLESDCRFVRSWLQSSLHAEDVRQSVLALDVFIYLCGITQLLKQQPHGDTDRVTRQKQRHPYCDLSVTVQNTMPPSDSDGDSSGNSVVDVGVEEMDIWQSGKTAQTEDIQAPVADLPNKEQWLALRVQGGSRNWLKFSSCFP